MLWCLVVRVSTDGKHIIFDIPRDDFIHILRLLFIFIILLQYILKLFRCQLPKNGQVITLKHVGAMSKTVGIN